MSKALEKGPEKIQKICDLLKKETLEPAKLEAESIIAQAREEAARIIQEAKHEAEQLNARAHESIEREKNVFQASLTQASRQCIEALRQSVESEFFNSQLLELIDSQVKDPAVIANLIKGILAALEKEGTDVDLSAVIPRTVSVEAVNSLLGEGVLKKLREHKVISGNILGGAQVKLHGKELTLDLSDSTMKELVANYVRKDFRKWIFGA